LKKYFFVNKEKYITTAGINQKNGKKPTKLVSLIKPVGNEKIKIKSPADDKKDPNKNNL
jgi:hypothetical protein